MNETQEIIRQLGALSYGGVFIVSLLANIVIPVPEEVALLVIGFAARAGGFSLFLIIPIVMAGLLTSDIALYYASRRGNRLVTGFYNRIFKNRLTERQQWLEDNVKKVIFFSRFLVQLRFLGPFFAGQTKVSWKTFITYELAALIIYVPLVVGIGWFFHSGIENIISGINVLRNVFLIFLGLLFLFSLYESIRINTFGKRTRKKNKKK
ncbi:MAG: rane-associated protein SNARE-like [Candidatus Nomurabacteria bacterium]|nr:rane-associated protein SNARE-like [Candidatus Nomurabacteria bacterium]